MLNTRIASKVRQLWANADNQTRFIGSTKGPMTITPIGDGWLKVRLGGVPPFLVTADDDVIVQNTSVVRILSTLDKIKESDLVKV